MLGTTNLNRSEISYKPKQKISFTIKLNTMKRLLLLFASIAMMLVACTEGGLDGGKEPDGPTPTPQKPTITIETGTSSNFDEDGGNGTISFTASEAWTAEVINSRADSWVSIHPTSGAAGSAKITVTTEPNDTPDDRSATIKIKAGSAEKSVKVSQKQKDALTVTASSFEVPAEGGEVKIEVKANVDFDYQIEGSAEDWIEHKSTRAMKSSTLTFAVAKNDDTERRDAKIYITNGDLTEVVNIYQAGAEPTIVISQNEYVVAATGETIAVEVASNVNVTVELPKNTDWITENATRGVSTNTYYFDIAPSEEYEQRAAEIKFTNAENGLSEVVTVVQVQKDALVVAKDSYTVSSEGGQIEIEIGHNVEFDITTSVDWIKKAADTRAFTVETLVFDIAANPTPDNREGKITFKSKDGSLTQIVTVYQAQEETIILSESEVTLEAEGGSFRVDVKSNYEYTVNLSLSNWIRQIDEPTRALTLNYLYFEYDDNPSAEERVAYIYIDSKTSDKTEIITVTQKGAELSADSFELVGIGKWTDDIIAPVFGCEVMTYEVEVYKNPAAPEYVFLKDLYTNAYTDVLIQAYGIKPETIPVWDTSYFAVNIADPNAVTIPNQTTGLDLGYGDISIWSLDYGTLKDGVVTFPANGLAVKLPEAGAYYANQSGEFKLELPKEEEEDEEEYVLLGTGRWTDDIVAPLYGLEAKTYDVEVYENPNKPEYIYLKDLYTKAYADVFEEQFGIEIDYFISPSAPTYFEIYKSDSTSVFIPLQNIGLDITDGEIKVGSIDFGSIENGVITFPTNSIALQDDEGTYYANRNGQTKLQMPGAEITTPEGYVLLGVGHWADDIVGPLFSKEVRTYEVEIYENPNRPGCFYLKDLYTKAYAGVFKELFNRDIDNFVTTTETTYFEIDATNASAVNIPFQRTGLNLGYDEMWIWSLDKGTLKDGVISFPTRGLAIQDNESAYYANKSGMAKLYMPGNNDWKMYESTDYSNDGKVKQLQKATKGNGIDIVLMGDAFSDRLIADGTYDKVMNTAMEKMFVEEPYKSFRDHFNVYSVTAVSANEVYTGGSSTAFSGEFGEGTYTGGDDSRVFEYAEKAIDDERINDALIVVMMNSTKYAGTCWMYYAYTGDWGNGVSISYFPIGTDDKALEQVLQHEAGGHGFSKLGDEYSYESMGEITSSEISRRKSMEPYGWWKNVDFTNNSAKVKWSHFLSDERYANEGLGLYEGGFSYWSGVWHSTKSSIMNANVDGFNAPSRESIYYRIHKLAYGADWEYDYETFVEWDARNRKAESRAHGVPYRVDVPEDFTPLHPPVVVSSSWREAKNNAAEIKKTLQSANLTPIKGKEAERTAAKQDNEKMKVKKFVVAPKKAATSFANFQPEVKGKKIESATK